ncbi:MAG TPA: hypothetical protein EYP49_16255 [Anaerolineae bacterium]|nr:hypothetical protein [Anaerolineae bacterium]
MYATADRVNGYCLAACAQMVLAHLGVYRFQDGLAREWGVCPPPSAPASNLIRFAYQYPIYNAPVIHAG